MHAAAVQHSLNATIQTAAPYSFAELETVAKLLCAAGLEDIELERQGPCEFGLVASWCLEPWPGMKCPCPGCVTQEWLFPRIHEALYVARLKGRIVQGTLTHVVWSPN
jgi:hypothetical protein